MVVLHMSSWPNLILNARPFIKYLQRNLSPLGQQPYTLHLIELYVVQKQLTRTRHIDRQF